MLVVLKYLLETLREDLSIDFKIIYNPFFMESLSGLLASIIKGFFIGVKMEKLFESEEKLLQLKIENEVQKRLSELIKDPLFVIKSYQEALVNANNQIEVYKPKAELYEITMGSDALFEMSAVAKTINFKGMGRNNLFQYLRSKEILRYNDEPYQKYVDNGCFKIIKQSYKVNGEERINKKTMTTQKGIDYIVKLLLGDGYECNDR